MSRAPSDPWKAYNRIRQAIESSSDLVAAEPTFGKGQASSAKDRTFTIDIPSGVFTPETRAAPGTPLHVRDSFEVIIWNVIHKNRDITMEQSTSDWIAVVNALLSSELTFGWVRPASGRRESRDVGKFRRTTVRMDIQYTITIPELQ